MDAASLQACLADINLPALRYFDRLDSSNAEAWRWVAEGAHHLALVVADEQTAGKGRSGRRWVTPPGAALAFSLILLSPPFQPQHLPRLTGLGAVAVKNALHQECGLSAQIKWPNDILLDQRKAAGVLVETRWSGSVVNAAVIGIGINIAPSSVSEENLPPTALNFPATCVEASMGHPLDRLGLLHAILHQLLQVWLPKISTSDFIHEWEASLAYSDQWVEISSDSNPVHRMVGKVIGLTQDGSLKLVTSEDQQISVTTGEVHLRPVGALHQPQE